MRAETITGPERLAALLPAWTALFDRVPDAPPFASPAWLMPWWEVFAPGRLHGVAVWDGARLVALAPLYVEHGPLGRRLLPLGIGLSDALDILLDPAHEAEAARALMGEIAAGAADWDVWSAEEAPPGAAVLALPLPEGWQAETVAQSACPELELPPGPDPLRAAVPGRKLRKWRMAQNRTARRPWSLALATADSLAGDLDHLFALHGARWQSRGEAGVLAEAAVRRFHALAAPRLFEAGLLRLQVLRIEGRVAGVQYGFSRGATACAYIGGFDPGFAFESPGTVLVGAALDDAVRAGVRRFSFLRGQEAYKYEWGALDRWTARRTLTVGR